MNITYEEFLQMTSEPTVVDFWAEWCGPCKMFSPTFDEVSSEYQSVNFIKINIDENEDLCKSLGIMSIPTIHFYSDSMLSGELRGAVPKGRFVQFIEENLE